MSDVTCREALARLYEYLDGELPDASAEEIRAHFELCQCCYPHLRYATAFQQMLARVASGQRCAPPELRRKVADLLRAEASRSGG
ncbi:MAG TPA: zf-HC2 domain-containing protein [Longimicrobiales bacterium]